MEMPQDTIVAVATPPGQGGIGVVRISGPLVSEITYAIVGELPASRYAHYASFRDGKKQTIDQGLTLYFPAPHSFTGEDVVELHGHGGPVVLGQLVKRAIELGARPAQPGEFSKRAFLNDKLDLVQAEAIADLIASRSEAAARGAMRSLQGAFSTQIQEITERVIELRAFVEAAIDFPEEEIDFLADGEVGTQINALIEDLNILLKKTRQGTMLQTGFKLVIVGPPNAGKSSLLNVLTEQERAIVSDIPGTTRDLIDTDFVIDGLPIRVIDTAGLRESQNSIESEGIRRALQAVADADGILLVLDDAETGEKPAALIDVLAKNAPAITVYNKIDLSGRASGADAQETVVGVSTKTGDGLDALKTAIKALAGFHLNEEDGFIARARHVDALQQTLECLFAAQTQMIQFAAGELVAEDLTRAHTALAEITGKMTSDQLLGRIFSSFCIGK